jgi:hypothetical protein
MHKTIALGVVTLALGLTVGTAEASSDVRTRPTLQVVRYTPLIVRGRHFQPAERIRVTAAGRTWRLRANRSGAFVLSLGEHDRCNWVRVVAVGSEGSRVILKILPSPACAPA